MKVTMIMDYQLRPVHIYSVLTTEASFYPANYKERQYTISSFMSRCPRDDLPFCEGVFQHLTFDDKPLPIPKVDCDDMEYLPTADLDDSVWSKDPMPDSWEYLCIHLYPDQQPPPHNPIKWRWLQCLITWI